MTTQGMAFWRGLWNRTGQGSGLLNVPALGLTATGTTQANALSLTADWNQVSTTPASSGVVMPVLVGGQAILIANKGANALNVYPPSGSQIDALGANAAYSLASTKLQIFSFFSAGQIYSLQLG